MLMQLCMLLDSFLNKRKLSSLTFIDLFAGIGGFHQALASFGANCVYASEFDSFAAKIYQKNYGMMPAGDITKVNERKIPKHDILCAGFPCQPFSISGKQKGFEDTRGTLFFDIVRIIDYHHPKIVFLENVANFEKHDNGRTLKTILQILENQNYSVFYKVLNASNFGIPQNRKRIYIVAFHKKLNIRNFCFPTFSNCYSSLEKLLQSDDETLDFSVYREDMELENKSILPDMYGNYPQCPIRIGKVGKGGQGERIYHPKGHAITLSAYGGGVGAKTGLYYINDKLRRLSPRECARLMGYPDSFIIDENKNQAYKQFGNGVVIDVLQHILNEIEVVL